MAVAYVGGEGIALSGPTPDEALLAALRQAANAPQLRFLAPTERLAGGFWAEIIAVRLGGGPPELDGDLVVRIMPDPVVATQELIVQKEVVAQGFPAPRVRLSGGPDDGLERPFIVMDRVQGRPPIQKVSGIAALAVVGRAALRLPQLLASVTARLHALDPAPLRERLEGADAVVVDLDDLLALLLQRAESVNRSDLVRAAERLPATRPTSLAEVICHGDLQPLNLLVDENGRVSVVDWSVALIADPAFDLAFTAMVMALAPVAVPRGLRATVAATARNGSRTFLRRYRRHAPAPAARVSTESLAWHAAVHCLRALVEVAEWAEAGTADERAGHPWLVMGPQMAARLAAASGERVRPR